MYIIWCFGPSCTPWYHHHRQANKHIQHLPNTDLFKVSFAESLHPLPCTTCVHVAGVCFLFFWRKEVEKKHFTFPKFGTATATLTSKAVWPVSEYCSVTSGSWHVGPATHKVRHRQHCWSVSARQSRLPALCLPAVASKVTSPGSFPSFLKEEGIVTFTKFKREFIKLGLKIPM